ncbi:hypothetical protein RF55_14475 [Lasius niger]|uniref:Uncharacterized protein n=1 Tax=Lasius niger TaxID=67767 RepID=A0A0J7K8H1_LASNI|nr:hypothetical protein RF55_14475 [Lasius niger]
MGYDVVELFGKTYRKCQTGEIAAKGFSISGIYPFNRYVFTEVNYLAAANEMIEKQQSHAIKSSSRITEESLTPVPNVHVTTIRKQQSQPGPSLSAQAGSSRVTPFDIVPIPQFKKRTSNRDRKPGRSAILSSSPYKKELEEAKKKKTEKRKKVEQKSAKVKGKRRRKRTPVGKNRDTNSFSNSSIDFNSDTSEEIGSSFEGTGRSTEQDAMFFL